MICAAGEVTVGMASQWPCVTDNGATPTDGLTTSEWETRNPCVHQRHLRPLSLQTRCWSRRRHVVLGYGKDKEISLQQQGGGAVVISTTFTPEWILLHWFAWFAVS